MKKHIFLALIGLSFCLWACIDEIALNVDTEQRTLVVDGFVSDSLADYNLKLSLSSVIGIGNDNILDPVPGARVQVLDNEGNSFPYTELEDGSYQLKNFQALRGKSYLIDIVLSDGSHYQSTPAMLRSSSLIDKIDYKVEETTYRNNTGDFITENVISTTISTDISQASEPPFLRWRVSGEFQIQEGYPGALDLRRCYVQTNLDFNDIRLLDASQLNNGEVFEQVIAETTYDFRFGEQFCFHISQYSISEAEFTYWKNIQDVIDIDGGLFDPPPGTVVGNIRNVDNPDDVAVGYFSVSSVFFTRAFINSNELDVFVRPKCAGFQRTTPFGCRDCLDFANSTRDRPDYWEF